MRVFRSWLFPKTAHIRFDFNKALQSDTIDTVNNQLKVFKCDEAVQLDKVHNFSLKPEIQYPKV